MRLRVAELYSTHVLVSHSMAQQHNNKILAIYTNNRKSWRFRLLHAINTPIVGKMLSSISLYIVRMATTVCGNIVACKLHAERTMCENVGNQCVRFCRLSIRMCFEYEARQGPSDMALMPPTLSSCNSVANFAIMIDCA